MLIIVHPGTTSNLYLNPTQYFCAVLMRTRLHTPAIDWSSLLLLGHTLLCALWFDPESCPKWSVTVTSCHNIMTALLVGRVPVTAHPLVQSSFPMPSTTEPPFLRPSLERRVSLMFFFVVVLLSSLQAVEAHLAAWHRGTWVLLNNFSCWDAFFGSYVLPWWHKS